MREDLVRLLQAVGLRGGAMAAFVGVALMTSSMLPADAMATTICPSGTGNAEFLEGQYSETSLHLSSNSYGSGSFGLAQCETVNTRTLEYTIPAEDFTFYESLWHMTNFGPWNWWFTVLGPATGKLEPVLSGESLEGYRSTLTVNVSLTLHYGSNTCKASPIALEMTTGTSGSLEGSLFKGSLSSKLEGKLVANTFSVPKFAAAPPACSSAVAQTLNSRGSLPAPAGQATLSVNHVYLFPYGPLPKNTAPPTITPESGGILFEGEKLTASPGSWEGGTPVENPYTWERCKATCERIASAQGHKEYAVSSQDVGYTIRVAVTASNSGGEVQATSAPTSVVPATYDGFSGSNQPPASWRPYAGNSVWNQEVPEHEATSREVAAREVLPESPAVVEELTKENTSIPESERPHPPPQNLLAGVVEAEGPLQPGQHGGDFGHPIYWAKRSDPPYTLVGSEAGLNECALFPSPISGITVNIPAGAKPADGTDGHMAVVEPNGAEYDLFQAKELSAPSGMTPGKMEFVCGSETQINGSGLGAEETASHFDLAAGIMRPAEMQNHHINHALFVAVHEVKNIFRYPATSSDGRCSGACLGAPPMGARLWLAMNKDEIKALALPPWEEAIAVALNQYGAYVGDSTGAEGFVLSFESPMSTLSFAAELPTTQENDPMLAFAETERLNGVSGHYDSLIRQSAPFSNGKREDAFLIFADIPWSTRLKVIKGP
jgi:hypothetical protein